MNSEPWYREEYDSRQTEAARRVLVDVGQVLAAFQDCVVVVGGWVPDLLLPDAEEPHVGSIDVDLALDATKLEDGRYAELIGALLATRRYLPGSKSFQFVAEVDLEDGKAPVRVDVDFLAARDIHFKKNRPKLVQGFRVLQAEACGAAFRAPVLRGMEGRSLLGATNRVVLHVASIEDFLLMKAHALAGRDKPKDAYDLCYCLDHYPGGVTALATNWRGRRAEPDVARAVEILQQKFAGPGHYGPMQVAEFFAISDADQRAIAARRAFELVQKFLAGILE